MSNIIILSLLSLGLATSFSFIYSIKKEFYVVESTEIEGSSKLSSKSLDLESFHSIEVDDQMRVEIKQGGPSISISAEDNLLDKIKIENRDSVLFIYRDFEPGEQINQNLPMIVRLSNPELRSIVARRQSEVNFLSSFKQEMLYVRLSEQSNLNGSVEIGALTLEISQQARARLSGTANSIQANISDQSDLRCSRLEAASVEINARNQTNASIYAREIITGNLSGDARLNLKGSPKENQISKTSRARVNEAWD